MDLDDLESPAEGGRGLAIVGVLLCAGASFLTLRRYPKI